MLGEHGHQVLSFVRFQHSILDDVQIAFSVLGAERRADTHLHHL
jgi:hypothetical protein